MSDLTEPTSDRRLSGVLAASGERENAVHAEPSLKKINGFSRCFKKHFGKDGGNLGNLCWWINGLKALELKMIIVRALLNY